MTDKIHQYLVCKVEMSLTFPSTHDEADTGSLGLV